MSEKISVTLTLYPNTYGIGFVLAQGPGDILDYGLKQVDKRNRKEYLAKTIILLDFYEPELLILRDPTNPGSHISKLQVDVLTAIQTEATFRKLEVRTYSRRDIEQVFEIFKSTTKHEIASAICRWYPQLESKMPHQRKAWMSEHYHMGVFDAFSLMLTDAYLN